VIDGSERTLSARLNVHTFGGDKPTNGILIVVIETNAMIRYHFLISGCEESFN